jgi:hypothetical protein
MIESKHMITLWGLYAGAMLLCFISGEVGRKFIMYSNFSDNSWDWLIHVSGLSIWVGFALLITGFFIFSWYLVFITFFFSGFFSCVAGTHLINGLRQHVYAPMIVLLSAICGILLALFFSIAWIAY